jgi:hypothetical protein
MGAVVAAAALFFSASTGALADPAGVLTPAAGGPRTVFNFHLTGLPPNTSSDAYLEIDNPGSTGWVPITLPNTLSTGPSGIVDINFSFGQTTNGIDLSTSLPLPSTTSNFQVAVCAKDTCMASKGRIDPKETGFVGIPFLTPSPFSGAQAKEHAAACFLFRQVLAMNGVPMGMRGLVDSFTAYATYLDFCNFSQQQRDQLGRLLFGDGSQ